MVRTPLLGIVILAAATGSWPAAAALSDDELLSGAALGFGSASAPSLQIPSATEVFGLDAEMQAFVAPLATIRAPEQRLSALLKSMTERGLFSLEYAETTRTARGTFHDQQGNCLSFTMLFVALAREAGLNAVYRNVEVPPSWTMDGQVVIAEHVNAVVRTKYDEETTVDFNVRDSSNRNVARRVSDAYALALFYTNLGAEGLLAARYAQAFEYLRAAARTDPEMPGVWVNLGVLYARYRLFDHAEAAYLRALEVAPDEPSALANLALVYEALGNQTLAAAYEERVQRYRERNPYYHYSLAKTAFDEQRFADALGAVRRALRLKHDEPEFYALRGGVLANLGRARDAEQDYTRAREYAAEEDLRRASRVKFDGLALR